ncbi:MAG: biopolymer transporter ExbD [bacterium]
MLRLKNRSNTEEEVDIDLIPIMNAFLVILPFLLFTTAFYELSAIKTSVPVLAENKQEQENNNPEKPPEKTEIKLKAINIEVKKNEIHLSVLADELGEEELVKWDKQLIKNNQNEYPLDQVTEWLKKIKESYPKSDTVIILPEKDILYDTIIRVMDGARYSENKALFPNVVISGKVE